MNVARDDMPTENIAVDKGIERIIPCEIHGDQIRY